MVTAFILGINRDLKFFCFVKNINLVVLNYLLEMMYTNKLNGILQNTDSKTHSSPKDKSKMKRTFRKQKRREKNPTGVSPACESPAWWPAS